MDYRKPSKTQANEAYLRTNGMFKVRPYREGALTEKKKFLIICEGENTEPFYFRGFPVPSNEVLIEGGCHSKNALVDYALSIRDRDEYAGREVWCVFDFDYKPDERATQPHDFNSAIEKAQSNGLKVAWSNDAFELWFVLHYVRLDAALRRHELYDILKDRWQLNSFRSAKSKEFCKSHYSRHDGKDGSSQELAIRVARELHQRYHDNHNFASQCPCTTVYLLVEELNKNCK